MRLPLSAIVSFCCLLASCADLIEVMPALQPPASLAVVPGNGDAEVAWDASRSEAERGDIGGDETQGGYVVLRTTSATLDSVGLRALIDASEFEAFLLQDTTTFWTFDDTLLFARRLGIEARRFLDSPVPNHTLARYSMLTHSDDGARSAPTAMFDVVPHVSFDAGFQVGTWNGQDVGIYPNWARFPLDLRLAPEQQNLSGGPHIALSLSAEKVVGEWRLTLNVEPAQGMADSLDIRVESCGIPACSDRGVGWSTNTDDWQGLADSVQVSRDEALFIRVTEGDTVSHFGRIDFPMPSEAIEAALFGEESPVYSSSGVLILEARYALHERPDWGGF
ncbi:MAG: hypothetical protein CME06_12435 [Gemmatimonadetes bacterium]|nr:hypothetical protein [Gemmatimonadota bacterium]